MTHGASHLQVQQRFLAGTDPEERPGAPVQLPDGRVLDAAVPPGARTDAPSLSTTALPAGVVLFRFT